MKEIINLGIKGCDNKNPKVRNAAIEVLSTIYKHLGESVRTFLKDIKDSTLAVINKEFDKITPLAKGEFKSKRAVRNDDAEEEVKEEDPLDCIPRADVSKELGGQKLLNMINNDAWKKRKEALDKMNAILEKANMRILPNGLSEIVGLLKVKMGDPNKSVAKGFLEFVGKFAAALGTAAKQYAPMLIKPLFRCLSEKNTLVRKINLEAIEKWSDAVGADVLIGSVGPVIAKDNPEIRSVLLDWVVKKKEFISKAELGNLPKALVSCLQDKAPKIRGMTELVIIEVLPHTGPASFKKIVKDLKPAVQNSVKPIMAKCIDMADIGDDGADEAPAKAKSGKAKPEEDKGTPDKALPAALAKARGPKAKKDKNRPKTAAPMTAQKIHEKLNKKPVGLGGKKKGGDDLEFQILEVGRKDKRNEADKKKRWHPEEIRGDYVEKLKNGAKSMFGEAFSTKMFSSDFKQHMKCIKMIRTVFDKEEMFESFLEVIDVIIKWAYIKSNEISNISFLKELYTFFDEIIDFLIEREYQFLEAEGNIFCLCLVEKIGMNNSIMKEKIKEIIMKVGNSTVYYPKKLMGVLMKGLNSKNTKTTAECCECIAQMVQTHQLEAINEKDVKVIAKQCESGDNGIRQGALLAVEEIYKITEDQFWTLVGNKLSTKAKDIIMARLNAHLGVSLNSTPIEDKKDTSRMDKSPMVGRGGPRSSHLNKSLNKSLNSKGKLNSSIPMSERRLGRNDHEEQKSIQSSSNISRKMDGMTTPRRRKDSSVNRKLERISSASRKNNELEANLEREIDKIKNKAKDGEVVQEILLLSEDPSYELDENLDSIGKNIKQLKYGDLSGKVDALVIINE